MVRIIDEEIIGSFGNGDFSKADLLYHKYKDEVFSFFRYRGVITQDAEDMTIEVFERVFSGARGFDTSRPFRPWFYQIARNALTDYFRRNTKRRIVDIDDFDFTDETNEYEQEEYQILYKSLKKLSAEDQDLILMAKFHQFPYSEISQHLSVSESVVKTRVHRIIKKLTSIYNEMMT